MSEWYGRREILAKVRVDCVNDAKGLDGQPFNGAVVAQFGNTLAMIAALCEVLDATLTELERLMPTETDPPFPPHNPDYPDVNPATGDERATTTGPATDGPWDGPDDDPLDAA